MEGGGGLEAKGGLYHSLIEIEKQLLCVHCIKYKNIHSLLVRPRQLLRVVWH